MRSRQPLGIEHTLLGLLDREPRHGYDLFQELGSREGLASVWRLKQGHLYALLGRLEQEGYIVPTLESQDSRPPRKVYALTELGREAFRAWMETPVTRGRQLRLEFLAKLHFALLESEEAALRLVSAQREACRTWDEAQPVKMAGPVTFPSLVGSFRASQVQASIAWLDACERTLRLSATPE
jgi:DNA-binding PadR family transcriptional regulator